MDPLGLYNSDFIDGLIQPIFRSNVLGTRFTVYDGGENPEKKPFVKECESLRQELAAICYVSLKWLLQSRNVLSNTKTRGKNFASVFAGSKRVRFKRPQKDDSDHPWYVGERRKSLNLPKKRKCNTSSFFFFFHLVTHDYVLSPVPYTGAFSRLVGCRTWRHYWPATQTKTLTNWSPWSTNLPAGMNNRSHLCWTSTGESRRHQWKTSRSSTLTTVRQHTSLSSSFRGEVRPNGERIKPL